MDAGNVLVFPTGNQNNKIPGGAYVRALDLIEKLQLFIKI